MIQKLHQTLHHFLLLLFISTVSLGAIQDLVRNNESRLNRITTRILGQAENPQPETNASSASQPEAKHPPTKTQTATSPTPPPQISEAELFQALTTYRQSHDRNPLVHEESLCVYARSRVAEHQARLATLKEGESALDNHAGFQRDADSGQVFAVTNMKAVAENLAYLPKFMTATQIIEWGWDTSTSHRNAQLSNDWTHACIAGEYPFYVGIFGHR